MHHETSCPQTPQQNGVAEHTNRHILEITRALLIATNVPKRFWADVVVTAVYLLNRLPSRVLDYKTPLPSSRPTCDPTVRSHASSQNVWLCCICSYTQKSTNQARPLCCPLCFSWVCSSQERISML